MRVRAIPNKTERLESLHPELTINHHGTDPNQVADPGKAGHPRSQPAHRTQPLNTQPLTAAAAQKTSSEALTAQMMSETLVGGTPTHGHLA